MSKIRNHYVQESIEVEKVEELVYLKASNAIKITDWGETKQNKRSIEPCNANETVVKNCRTQFIIQDKFSDQRHYVAAIHGS